MPNLEPVAYWLAENGWLVTLAVLAVLGLCGLVASRRGLG